MIRSTCAIYLFIFNQSMADKEKLLAWISIAKADMNSIRARPKVAETLVKELRNGKVQH